MIVRRPLDHPYRPWTSCAAIMGRGGPSAGRKSAEISRNRCVAGSQIGVAAEARRMSSMLLSSGGAGADSGAGGGLTTVVFAAEITRPTVGGTGEGVVACG